MDCVLLLNPFLHSQMMNDYHSDFDGDLKRCGNILGGMDAASSST